jgi:hypothetical protein
VKRISFVLLAITLSLVAACQATDNQNKNGNTNANRNANGNANRNQGILAPAPMGPTDKMVQIFVHDVKGKPGYYTIEDPGDVTLSTALKQRVFWCVWYDGVDPSLRPDDVIIDGFRTVSGPSVTNPFGNGSPADNDFDVPAVQINNCVVTLHSPKADVVDTAYKYTITAKVGGVDRGHLDPRVIIVD